MKVSGILLPMAIAAAVVVNLWFGEANADYAERDDVQAYISSLVAEHGFGREELQVLFSQAERKQSILDAIARPAERTLPWYEYRAIFIEEPRIQQGLQFWSEHEPSLVRAQAEFGVPPEYIVAIIGVETRYGRNAGSYRVVDALTTLGFDYPPRADFFRKELTQYLLLAREERMNPLDLKGSYAGAMGYGQFIPSSFRAYAVDFDGDGVRDIWNNPVDAIGSVANYFRRHGWQGDDPVALQVTMAGSAAQQAVTTDLNLDHTVAELAAMGVATQALDPDARAALYRMELRDGPEYWLALHNFYVITRYNRSSLYALAVHQLGQQIKARRAVETVQR